MSQLQAMQCERAKIAPDVFNFHNFDTLIIAIYDNHIPLWIYDSHPASFEIKMKVIEWTVMK